MTDRPTDCFSCGQPVLPPAVRQDGTDQAITYERICPSCTAAFHARIGWDRHRVSDFLNTFKSPLYVVDADNTVRTLNTAARKALGETAEETEEFRPGDIYECVNARLPGGCGKSEHCQACAIRLAVLGAPGTDRGDQNAAVRYKRFDTGRGNEPIYEISAERIGDFALLRIKPIEED